MSIQATLADLHSRARAKPWLQRFTIVTRILLAVAFIPTGLVKIQGERFTTLGPEHPVGYFFEAMYQTGLYWSFLGWGQLVAAVLLLIPRTATLGALLFLPIILNIFVITISIDFAGTPVVTGLMLLAVLNLLCWDYDRLEPALGAVLSPPASRAPDRAAVSRIGLLSERGAYIAATLGGLTFFGAVRALIPREVAAPLALTLLAVAGALALLAGVAARRTQR